MAISLPTDIVLDVARAASPESVEAARAELTRRTTMVQATTEATRAKDPYVKFESMVLGSFVQNMLPKDSEAVYGKGLAGEMWQGLLAQELGDVIAARGGIGIADRMLRDRYVEGETTVPVGPVKASSETDRKDLLSVAMVQEIQRRLTESIMENLTPDDVQAL